MVQRQHHDGQRRGQRKRPERHRDRRQQDHVRCDRYAECPRFVACQQHQGRHAQEKSGRHRHRQLLERLVPHPIRRPHRLRLRPVSFERSGRLGFRLRLDRRNSQRQRRSDRYRELRHELRRLLVRLGWHIAFDRLRLLGPHVLRPDAVRLQHEARGKRPDDARHSCLER